MFKFFSIKHAEESTKSDAKQTLTYNLVISFLPLIIAFVVLAFPGELEFSSSIGNIRSSFFDVFLSGQLYFYAMSFCASIAYLATQTEHKANRGMRLWGIVFVVFCVAFMAVFVTQYPSGTPRTSIHSITSGLFLAFSVLLNYRVLVLSNQPPPTPEEANRKDSESVAKKSEPVYD